MNQLLITKLKLFNSLVTAIGWWMALIFAILFTAAKLPKGEPVTIIHLIIPFVMLLVVIRSTRRYFYFRTLRKEHERTRSA